MRLSQLFTKTSMSAPAHEVSANAKMLIRAGYVHKEMAGVYAFLPLGLRVLENIKQIVREEMNAIGGQEVMMTALQPREIWEKTGRWDDKTVDNWFKTKLVNGTDLGIGFTHEEPIVDALSEYISSYKDLPVYVYQIQNKFRNELRAKSGLLRGREFVMKDMYSFAAGQHEHEKLYEQVIEAYRKVYDRLGIGDATYRTYADGGVFTDRFSDEFQTLSDVGEDTIYLDEERKLAINKEIYTDEAITKLGLDKEKLVEKKGVEVGNTFHLQSKYTDALGVYYTDEHGQQQSIVMGCYGIGISRLVGVLAERFSDDRGLVWPENVAPAKVYLARLGDDAEVVDEADKLYSSLTRAGVAVIYDDRAERPGKKFADAELLGIPYRVVVSAKTLESGKLELKARTSETTEQISVEALVNKLVG